MPKFEYKITFERDNEIVLARRLNELGRDRWELVSTEPGGRFIFKRPFAHPLENS